ncbi:hypothetical protein ABIB49_003078 [Arthrobacter sp. UYCu512]|uniref:hypothetical protein n=1 Tax=Arthrobacter sp. UYCu512 TaxID=3156338 RepID=UPI00339AE2ED
MIRAEGNDRPRHDDYVYDYDCSEREHALAVWIHTQHYSHRGGDLVPTKPRLPNQAVPGWQT